MAREKEITSTVYEVKLPMPLRAGPYAIIGTATLRKMKDSLPGLPVYDEKGEQKKLIGHITEAWFLRDAVMVRMKLDEVLLADSEG